VSFETLSQWLSGRPAQVFGIKGTGVLAEGAAADLVLVDITGETDGGGKKLFTRVQWSPYGGTDSFRDGLS